MTDIELWLPNYQDLGYTREAAGKIAQRAAELQDEDESRQDWTVYLSQASREFDAQCES